MEELISGLQEYGLSKKSAQVYITVLKLGAAPGATIARQSGLNRVTVYAILADLIEKGIAAKLKRKGIFFFSVIEPEGLIQVLIKKTQTLEGLLPVFRLLAQSIGEKPQIQYLEGEEGRKQMFADLMTMDGDMRSFIGSVTRKGDFIHEAGKTYKARRLHNKRKAFQLVVDRNYAQKTTQKQVLTDGCVINTPNELRQIIVLDQFPAAFEADVNIYGPEKVSLSFIDDNGGMHVLLIKSKQLYEFMLGIFNYIWNSEISKANKI